MPLSRSTARNGDESGERPSYNVPDIRLNLCELLRRPHATYTGSAHIQPHWYVYQTTAHVSTVVTHIPRHMPQAL